MERQEQKQQRIFFKFHGMEPKYNILSNLYFSSLCIDGLYFDSVEKVYVFRKAVFHDCSDSLIDQIMQAETGLECMRLGRSIKIKPEWHESKSQIMFCILYERIRQDISFREVIMETKGKSLHEHTNNKFWGYGSQMGRKTGQDWLGRMLTFIRDNYQDA